MRNTAGTFTSVLLPRTPLVFLFLRVSFECRVEYSEATTSDKLPYRMNLDDDSTKFLFMRNTSKQYELSPESDHFDFFLGNELKKFGDTSITGKLEALIAALY